MEDYIYNELKEKLYIKFFSNPTSSSWERYNHSLGVAKKAVELVQDNNLDVDIDKAKIAGLIHDYAKFEKIDKYQEIIKKHDLDQEILNTNFSVLHALLGPYIIQEELGIFDEEILDAIKYHTTGKANMSKLSEVIYLADFIEENREGLIFDSLREVAKNDMLKAIAMQVEITYNKLSKNKLKIHENTIEMYENYKKYL